MPLSMHKRVRKSDGQKCGKAWILLTGWFVLANSGSHAAEGGFARCEKAPACSAKQRGLAQSKTLSRWRDAPNRASVLDCGSPLPLLGLAKWIDKVRITFDG